MSVTVKHINADASFLLIFSPEPHPTPADLKSTNGAFSILCDPWVSTGASIVNKPWFAITKRVIPAAVGHLSELEEPDVVLVSQNKPDHCHKDTLLQLRPEGKTIIAAEPGAARFIKSWNHFDPNRVHGLKKYDPKARFGNSLRIRLPPLSPAGHAGEVNISFIPARNYMTGLHNAFGITYQAPTHVRTLAYVSTIDLPRTVNGASTKYFHLPMSPATLPPPSPPPMSPLGLATRPTTSGNDARDSSILSPRPQTAGGRGHRPQFSRSSNTASSEFLPFSHQSLILPQSPGLSINGIASPALSDTATSPTLNIPFSFETESEPFHFKNHLTLPTPPASPSANNSPSSSVSYNRKSTATTTSPHPSISLSSLPITPARPKPVSILFAPHGLPLADLQPYVRTHLVRSSALPLTLLLHAFDHAQNPLLLGGNIMTGVAGGLQIARGLMARCWVSAHDEAKDENGFASSRLRITHCTPEEVRRRLWEGEDGAWLRKRGWHCDVRNLPVGAEMCISGAARDLIAPSTGAGGDEAVSMRESLGFGISVG